MASVKNPPSTAHIDEVMEYMPDEMLLAYYRQLARVANERKAIHRATVARTDGLTDEVSEYTHALAKQNENAWGTIEHAAQRRLAAKEAAAAQQAAQLRAASAPSSTTAAGTTTAPRSATGTPGTSVRSGTAVSTPAHTIATKGGKGPVLVGLKGEEAVRAIVDIGKPKKIRVNGRWRIPDGIKGKVLSEVKNVKKLNYRSQLRDYAKYARIHGYDFHLWVRRDVKLSKPLKAAIRRKEIVLRYIP